MDKFDPFTDPRKNGPGVGPWAVILGAVIILAGVAFTVTAIKGETGEPDPAVVASPSPSLTEEQVNIRLAQATIQDVADFIATHEETDTNVLLMQQIILESGCDFSEASLTTKAKRRDALATIYKLPSTHTGAIAQVTYGVEEGRWLVLGARVVCGETSPPIAE